MFQNAIVIEPADLSCGEVHDDLQDLSELRGLINRVCAIRLRGRWGQKVCPQAAMARWVVIEVLLRLRICLNTAAECNPDCD